MSLALAGDAENRPISMYKGVRMTARNYTTSNRTRRKRKGETRFSEGPRGSARKCRCDRQHVKRGRGAKA